MKELISRLNTIPGSYYEFIDSVVDYAEDKESRFIMIMDFLDANPSATPSDIIKFISSQPDFFDSDVPNDMVEFVV